MAWQVTADNIDDLREELNRLLKTIREELNVARGYSGDISVGARVKQGDDIIFTTTKKGPVLADDGVPQQFWRVFVDSAGAVFTESIDPEFKG